MHFSSGDMALDALPFLPCIEGTIEKPSQYDIIIHLNQQNLEQIWKLVRSARRVSKRSLVCDFREFVSLRSPR
jgi:hypothetical protein